MLFFARVASGKAGSVLKTQLGSSRHCATVGGRVISGVAVESVKEHLTNAAKKNARQRQIGLIWYRME